MINYFAAAVLVVALIVPARDAATQSMYKYRGEDGEWIFTDRAPPGIELSEIRELSKGDNGPAVLVTHQLVNRQLQFVAQNNYHAPVQLVIGLQKLHNVGAPLVDDRLDWLLQPRTTMDVLSLDAIEDNIAPAVEYQIAWLPGDPDAQHRPIEPYRAPFAVAREFIISQAFPETMTHTTADSYYAIDLAMPIGTDIYAARAGTVFDVSSTNYRGGLDPSREGSAANLIRILHDDGTYAVYAHLNWNTIRVRPGEVVERGQYIADSGNTGYTTGPHLHFAVIRNRGMRLESLPVVFDGPGASGVRPRPRTMLTAY